jgi:hypothetical protein
MAMPRGREPDTERMKQLTDGLPTKAAKIRALAAEGYTRSQIAAFMGTSYQHVRGVLVRRSQPQEEPSAYEGSDSLPEAGRARIDADGAIRFPTAVLEHLGLKPEGVVSWRMQGDEVVLMSRAAGWRHARDLLRQYVPEGELISDKFVAERRAEWGESD